MKNLNLLFLFTITIYLQTNILAQAGELDPDFNNGNPAFAELNIPYLDSINSFGITWDLGIQSDGKIITFIDAAGTQMIRFNTDGTIDDSFGTVTSLEQGRSLVIQDDDKIVLGTGFTGRLERYNSDGTIDESFISIPLGDSTSFYSLTIQPDGKILAFGRKHYIDHNTIKYYYNILVRFNADGSLDTSFGNIGKWIFNIYHSDWGRSVQFRADGVIYCMGNWLKNQTYLFKIYPDETIDVDLISFGNSFFSNNFHTLPIGHVHICGQSYENGQANIINTRLNAFGEIDITYGINGSTTDPSFIEAENASFRMNSNSNSSLRQHDGKIIANGVLYDKDTQKSIALAVKRYNVDGSVDTTFGVNGLSKVSLADVNINSPRIALDASGNIIQVGRIINADGLLDIIICRYLTSNNVGTLDFGIKNNSILVFPNPVSTNCTLKFSLTKEKNLSVFLSDGTGKIIYRFSSFQYYREGEHQLNLDLPSALPTGNYVITISDGTAPVSVQIFKQ